MQGVGVMGVADRQSDAIFESYALNIYAYVGSRKNSTYLDTDLFA